MKNVYTILAALSVVSALGFCPAPATAQVSITEVSSDNFFGEDWFELTNFGSSSVNLNGYYWDDDGPTGADGALFGIASLSPGESLIVLQGSETTDGIATAFRTDFSLPTSLQVLTEDDFTGPDEFSGLSSNGDEISLWDTDPNVPGAIFNLIDFVEFGAATEGVSFDFSSGSAVPSVAGTNGASTTAGGDVSSPGFAVAVPEPSSLALLTVCGVLAGIKRRRA